MVSVLWWIVVVDPFVWRWRWNDTVLWDDSPLTVHCSLPAAWQSTHCTWTYLGVAYPIEWVDGAIIQNEEIVEFRVVVCRRMRKEFIRSQKKAAAGKEIKKRSKENNGHIIVPGMIYCFSPVWYCFSLSLWMGRWGDYTEWGDRWVDCWLCRGRKKKPKEGRKRDKEEKQRK